MWNHFRSRINHVYVHFNLWEMILQSRVPSVIMPLFKSVVSQPHTHNNILLPLWVPFLRIWNVCPILPFFFTVYLISCSVVYESTLYSNLIKLLNSISPYRLIFLLSLAPQPLRDEKEYSLGSYPQFQLNNTCGAVGSRYFMLISAQRCFLARRILICFASASCNGFCMFIINLNNKWIYIIDIVVSSIKRVL